MDHADRIKVGPSDLRRLLASGVGAELLTGADLFTLAFALSGRSDRKPLTVDEAVDLLCHNGLPCSEVRRELVERIRRATSEDPGYVVCDGGTVYINRRVGLMQRLGDVLYRPAIYALLTGLTVEPRAIPQAPAAPPQAPDSPTPAPLPPLPPLPAPPELAAAPVSFRCGLGAPLLERLIAGARGRPATSAALYLDPPRAGHARAAAERFVLRNGLCEIAEVSMGRAIYVAATLAYVVASDDRREGLARVLLCAEDGAEPDDALRALFDLTSPGAPLRSSPAAEPSPERAASFLAARVESAVRAAALPLLGDVQRRHARDHERIASHFVDLITEAWAPRQRAELEGMEAEVARLIAERDATLRSLTARFAATVTCSPAALVWAEVPVARVIARLRRRKEARDVVLRLPAGAATLDRLTCEACGAATPKPAACDGRMHLLCEACAPNAKGRIACPACKQRRG